MKYVLRTIPSLVHRDDDLSVSGGVEKKEGWRSQRQMLRGSEPGGRSYVERVGVKKDVSVDLGEKPGGTW